jgi:uncharacterized membrane protein YoaK (UPF0700 family)
VQQYTSHMSGIVAAMADSLAVGIYPVVMRGLGAVLAFLSGATTTTLLVRWARSRRLRSEFALSLMAEASLLIVFGLTGRVF